MRILSLDLDCTVCSSRSCTQNVRCPQCQHLGIDDFKAFLFALTRRGKYQKKCSSSSTDVLLTIQSKPMPSAFVSDQVVLLSKKPECNVRPAPHQRKLRLAMMFSDPVKTKAACPLKTSAQTMHPHKKTKQKNVQTAHQSSSSLGDVSASGSPLTQVESH